MHAVYKEAHEDFDDMTTLAKDLRSFLDEHVFIHSLKLTHRDESKDGQTTKFLFETHDGLQIESVIMRHKGGRNTVCISSQVGCAMACVFCATGKL